MVDKSAKRTSSPKGADYCNTPGTSCYYDASDICVNCDRPKGWRQKARNGSKVANQDN